MYDESSECLRTSPIFLSHFNYLFFKITFFKLLYVVKGMFSRAQREATAKRAIEVQTRAIQERLSTVNLEYQASAR